MKINKKREIRIHTLIILFLLIGMITGCATGGRGPFETETEQQNETETEQQNETETAALEKKKNSRKSASESLIDQGTVYLKRGDYDGALQYLEKAIGINPANGLGYFYLAEIWVKKKDLPLAEKYNKLALLYLRHDQKRYLHAEKQQKLIESLLE